MKRKKTLKGFTLIELIVVIAILGILAGILVPSLVRYVRNAKMTQYNSNAKSVYSGAQLAITDIIKSGSSADPNTIYICVAEGSGQCAASGTVGGAAGGSSLQNIDITDYLGEDYKGYFGFVTDTGGTGTVYAMWSSQPVTAQTLQAQMTLEDVKNSFDTPNPVGCNPLAPPQP